MIRVLLAENQTMVRGALSALLTLEEDIEIVSEVARADEVVPAALATCHTVILTTFGRPGYLRRAMESGMVDFLVKDAPAA